MPISWMSWIRVGPTDVFSIRRQFQFLLRQCCLEKSKLCGVALLHRGIKPQQCGAEDEVEKEIQRNSLVEVLQRNDNQGIQVPFA